MGLVVPVYEGGIFAIQACLVILADQSSECHQDQSMRVKSSKRQLFDNVLSTDFDKSRGNSVLLQRIQIGSYRLLSKEAPHFSSSPYPPPPWLYRFLEHNVEYCWRLNRLLLLF